MKWSEITDEGLRKARLEYVDKRWSDLSGRSRDNTAETVRYLILVNAGGAIATLSFMGAMKSLEPIPAAPAMLALFVLGLAFVGLGRAVYAYEIQRVFAGFRRDVDSFYKDAIEWDELLRQDTERSGYMVAIDVIAWGSFACFLLGVGLGYVELFWR